MKEIGFHKTFYGIEVCGITIPEVQGCPFLEVECHMIILANGHVMELVSESPKKIPGPEKHGILSFGNHAQGHEFAK
jgi:hypothetical protein